MKKGIVNQILLKTGATLLLVALTCGNAMAQEKKESADSSDEASTSKEEGNRNVMLNAASANGPREIQIGLPSADVNVLGTLIYDLGRFGIEYAASPRHADGILVTGPVTENMRKALLDTWEAVRYSLSENRIESMARGALEMGCEGILINDGWFGARNSDRTSLGDWHVNTQKIPSGLTELADTVHRMGLLFGLWFEPEAVSTRSMLYKAHPEWVIGHGDESDAEGRHEALLDITRYDVQDWIVTTITRLAELIKLDYLRWDMNRHYSDIFTVAGTRDYGMYAHEYASALYRILSEIGARCPDMYIETSAGGGARFDLGMMSTSASIAPSVVSDPIERARIIANASIMYPQCVIGTVVSPSPNSTTRRFVDRETRFNIAAFGVLSYSMDPSSFSRSEMKAFREQTEFYKTFRLLLQTGRFRLVEDGSRVIWSVADEDRSTILLLYLQKTIRPNTTAEKLFVPDANESYDYRVFSRSHSVSEKEAYAYPEESECYTISGDALKWGGISMVEQLSGIGHHEGMRMLGDYSSRLYIIKRIGK